MCRPYKTLLSQSKVVSQVNKRIACLKRAFKLQMEPFYNLPNVLRL